MTDDTFDPVVNEPSADRDFEEGVLHGLRLALRLMRDRWTIEGAEQRIRAAIKRRKGKERRG